MYSSYKAFALVATLLILASSTLSFRSGSPVRLPKLSAQTTAPIQLNVTVHNGKRYVTELNQYDFQISVDNKPAKILHFSNQESPISVGILFDVSYSVGKLGMKKRSEKELTLWQQAMARFIALSNGSNNYFLVGFNVKPQLLVDWTSDAKVIIDKLGELKPSGETAVYDACYVAMEKLQHGRHPKRVLLLISDGVDTSSRYTFEDLKKLLRETDVLLYSVDLHTNEDVGSSFGMEGQLFLDALTATSGGTHITGQALKRRQDADEIFETIANELRNQYTIAIEPPSLSGDKWHKIKLKVKPPREMKDLTVRTREGFYLN